MPYWKQICSALAKIHIVDKFLIVFMALLMFQSAHSLFAGHTVSGESAHIDIIIRTSTAAIFGYFLSTNFMSHAYYRSKGIIKGSVKSIDALSGGMQNRIGFTPSDLDNSANNPDIGSANFEELQNSSESGVSKLQIIITSIIGLFCLASLIVARDISALNAELEISASATATGAQFRDIVSGCIGFLIGCPTVKAVQSK